MKLIIVENFKPIKWLGFAAITLYPFILFGESKDQEILKHEMVHVTQVEKNGIIKFYTLYLYYFIKNLIKYRDMDKAYREIPFEKEAYGTK